MDPASIVGLLASAATIAATITGTIKDLSNLRAQYRDADLRIRLLIGELSTVKSALTQINDWTHYLDDTHRQVDVVEALNVSLESCQLAIDALAEEVRSMSKGATPSASLGFRAKTRYAWSESSLNEHESRMRAQIAALQLLLKAVQCNSTAEGRELLQNANSQEIMQRVADDTSTLRTTMSERGSWAGPPTIISHDDSTIDSKIFDLDAEIVKTDIYRRTTRHARSKSDMAATRAEREEELDTSSLTGTEKSSDRLPPMETPAISQRRKPLPYEMSVAPEPPYGKRSNRILAPPERTPSTASTTSTPGSRRGRRGFENSYHTSVDLASEEGLTAPSIVKAAQAGSVVEVEKLLDQRSDINDRHVQSGRSALAVAAHCGNEDVLRLLLKYGAMVDERDAYQLTPLHLAASRGHLGVVESLLQEHADIDAKGPNNQTPLHIAAKKGHTEVAEVLLRNKAKVNARDMAQMTSLHICTKHGDEDMTELLVNYGAHVEAKDSNFMGPIHYACEGGHTAVVTILLNKKADLEAPGKASMTPLLCASSAGQSSVVELLLKRKASLKHKGEGEMTALHWASYKGHVEVADLLLQKRAPISATTIEGRTPLHLAVIAQEFAIADLLLRKGAPIEAQCNSMMKPLHCACYRPNPEIMKLLLGYNANIEAEDSAKNRPIHKACTLGSLAHVELLIQKGANIDARNAEGDRPLCLASDRGHVEMVRVLLDHGAALRLKFSSGPSHEDAPLCIAAKSGRASVCQELLMRGTSVLQKDERNWQPLRYAAFNAHPEVVELLLRHGATVSGSASGGWGFNITAQRIGFATDVTNEEHRKEQVLRLLTSAEEREQREQDRTGSRLSPGVPPAVQNQVSPTELPDPGTAAFPVQASRPPPQPPLPHGISRTRVEPPYGAGVIASNATTQPYHSPHPLATEMPVQSWQQPRYTYYPSNAANSQYTTGQSTPNLAYAPTPYGFLSQAAPASPPGHHDQEGQSQPMPNGYPSSSAFPSGLTMTLGPNGLWQQVPNPGMQRVPSRTTDSKASAAPINYPTGVYEMSS